MELKFPVRIECSDAMKPHIQEVLNGEYDIPLFGYGLKILDVGANVGAFTIYSVHRWPGSSIMAFEPHPRNAELFLKNTQIYSDVIKLMPVGIGLSGKRFLSNGQNNEGEASFFGSSKDFEVEVMDPLGLPEADILKIDTEGCEIEILEPLIRAGRIFQAIMVEFHTVEHRREIDSLLKNYVLVKSKIMAPSLGTLCYINGSIFK